MNYYLDTEFIENGRTIDLISIAIVSENGQEYYVVNKECDFSQASDWVLLRVLNPMGIERDGFIDPGLMSNVQLRHFYAQKTRKEIAYDIMCFVKLGTLDAGFSYQELIDYDRFEEPNFWADYCAYDWVALCQLFGSMIDLPKGFPMYCHDLRQEIDRVGMQDPDRWYNGELKLPEQDYDTMHDALGDARWVREVYHYLKTIEVDAHPPQ